MGNTVSSICVAVIESNPVTASVKSAYHLCKGETSEAKQTFMRGLELIDKIPVAGHIKGGLHKLADDEEGAAKAFKSANRSTLVIGGAAAVVATGGTALVATGCAVGIGQVYNLATGDSKLVQIGEAITDTKRSGWDKFGNVVLQTAGLAAEVAGDVAGAKAGIKIGTRYGPAQGLKPNSRSTLTPKCDQNIGQVIKKGGPCGDVYHNKAANTYTKVTTNLTNEGCDPGNYTKAMKHGIGPNALQTTNHLHMEGGVSLEEAVKKGLISKKSLSLQVDQLQQKCWDMRVAHCDVKPSNMIVTNQAQTRLIDFDHLAGYGEHRTVFTPGYHSTPDWQTNPFCSRTTDVSGFNSVRARISAFREPPIHNLVARPLRDYAVLNNISSHLAPKPSGGPRGGNPWGAA